jgi:hypothetical protein
VTSTGFTGSLQRAQGAVVSESLSLAKQRLEVQRRRREPV